MKFIYSILFVGMLIASPLSAMAADSSHDEKAGNGPFYVDIDPISVPIIRENGRTGVISLALTAEMSDEGGNEKVRAYMPRLRDAFITSLYGRVIEKDLADQNGMLRIDSLKSRLIMTANYVLKDAKVNDILLDKVAQHSF